MQFKSRWGKAIGGLGAVLTITAPGFAYALETSLTAPGASEDLTDRIKAASSSLSAESRRLDSSQELLAAALSDYNTLVQVLYDAGYFSPVVHIRLDGREAAYIDPLNTPGHISRIDIDVKTGPTFRFGKAEIGPLAPETELPDSYAAGKTATTGAIRDAAIAGIDGWRNVGHAKADVGDRKITANHRDSVLNSDIRLLPGPSLTFGTMTLAGTSGVRPEAIAKIAGFPTGEIYSPAQVQKVTTRLRRTGAFSSVSVKEAENPNSNGTLDFETTVKDMPLHRLSFGVELSSNDGLDLLAKWTQRNLFGAAERLRLEATIRNIGGQERIDGHVSARLDRPATLGPDDNTFYLAELERRNQTHYTATRGLIGFGVRRVFSENLFAEAALTGGVTIADDAYGTGRRFALITLPINVEWDKRDDKVNASRGFFLNSTFTPFTGFSNTESGAQVFVDGRGYLSLTPSNSIVLAGRLQLGSMLGASQTGVSPEYLFFSGGAGTVRGQPFESLGIPVGNATAGGRSLLVASAEIRGYVTEKISLVGFFDFGAVDSSTFVNNGSSYHSGAGLGLRYYLGGFGPLRLDLALPVAGSTGGGLQFYLGIGQAF